ncbi:MAG: hypothetical protein KF905_02880 [Flavobacteriales bacterium]|nr:hypothetical protein [Flavobacteriales bacterium]
MRLRIDYFDQNSLFESLLPRAGVVERVVPALDSKLTWYLLRLDAPLTYEGSEIDRFIIAARWQDHPVGREEATSIFILVVSVGSVIGGSFSTSEFAQVAWGMAEVIST